MASGDAELKGHEAGDSWRLVGTGLKGQKSATIVASGDTDLRGPEVGGRGDWLTLI